MSWDNLVVRILLLLHSPANLIVHDTIIHCRVKSTRHTAQDLHMLQSRDTPHLAKVRCRTLPCKHANPRSTKGLCSNPRNIVHGRYCDTTSCRMTGAGGLYDRSSSEEHTTLTLLSAMAPPAQVLHSKLEQLRLETRYSHLTGCRWQAHLLTHKAGPDGSSTNAAFL
jgi:hypothetical protein